MRKLINFNKLIFELDKHNLEHFDIKTKEELNNLPIDYVLDIAKYFDIDINDYIIADIV